MVKVRYLLLVLGCGLLVMAGLLWDGDRASGQDSPAPGDWNGTVEFEADSGLGIAELSFQVDEGGQVTSGAVILKFSYPTMSDELLDLMVRYGCVVPFDRITHDSTPIAGTFASDTQASGTFTAIRCTLQDYGDLEFMAPLQGRWSATTSVPASTTVMDGSAKPTRMPTLDPNQPTARPTRMPTLDPNVPTQDSARPTRVPTLDPDQPTPKPTRSPTLDPNQPTLAPDLKPQDSEDETATSSSAVSPAVDNPSDSSTDSVAIAAANEFPNDPPGPHPTDNMSARQMYKEFCDECHGQQGIGTEDAPELEALNAGKIAETVRDGPEDMDVFTHEDIPDRALNKLIDYVLLFHPDSEPRTSTIITPPTTE